MNDEKPVKTPEDSLRLAYHGTWHSLERINELLQHCQMYAANDHLLGHRNNLREIFKESQGFLSKAEKLTAWNKWREIEVYPITIKDEQIVFDPKLRAALDHFDFWIRLKLHNHNVTFSKKAEHLLGLEKIEKKYNI